MNKQIIVIDKWNNKKIYDNVYKYKLEKNKLHIFSKANKEKKEFSFNLTYVYLYLIADYKKQKEC